MVLMQTIIPAAPARHRKPNYIPRGALSMFDIFRPKGSSKWYLHTGRRTNPPSEMGYPPVRHFGVDIAGNFIVGFNSVRVKGTGPVAEDGSCVSFNAEAPVEKLGNAGQQIAQVIRQAEAWQRHLEETERRGQAAASAAAATANFRPEFFARTPLRGRADYGDPYGWMRAA